MSAFINRLEVSLVWGHFTREALQQLRNKYERALHMCCCVQKVRIDMA